LDALHDIAAIVARRGAPRSMFAEILGFLEKRLGMARGTIMLLLPGNQELVVEAVRSAENVVRTEARYLRGEGIIGKVVETGKPIVVPRIADEPHFKGRIHRRSRRDRADMSFICVPVLIDDEVVGTISVDVPPERRGRLEYADRLIAIIASMVASHLKAERILCLEREALEAENVRLRRDLGERFRPESLVGSSHVMQEVCAQVQLVSQSDTTVLIRGASGTGKELIASAIHYASPRREAKIVKVNCAALNENLLESELFGHERGSFTGAQAERVGRIEEAEGGTLFLDEIGEFSPATQAKLLRVLQERQYERVGSSQTRVADIRLITATNRNLEDTVRNGTFREDLYYRINVFPIHVPPLSERKDDILALANHFVDRFNDKLGKSVHRISTEAIDMLMSYHWPGNVRELENCIEYAVLLSTDGVIYGSNLPPTLQVPSGADDSAGADFSARMRACERDMIVDALKRTSGNMTAAARDLGITLRMVRYKISNLGIDVKRVSAPDSETGAAR